MNSLLINKEHKNHAVNAQIEHDKNSVFIKDELDDTVDVNIELDLNSELVNKEHKDDIVDAQFEPDNSIFVKEELDGTVAESVDIDQNSLIINKKGLNEALSVENQNEIIETNDSMAKLVVTKDLLPDDLVSE